jgi:hypothetical protein
MVKTLKKSQIPGLYGLLKATSKSTLPIKFVIARNLNSVEPVFESYQEERSELHRKHVLINEVGEAIIKEEFAKSAESWNAVPYECFEYQSEEAKQAFFDELNAISDSDVEITIDQESLDRKVRTKSVGKDSQYELVSVRSLMEDPDCPIDADVIAALFKHDILI